jgi:uncharacterized protein
MKILLLMPLKGRTLLRTKPNDTADLVQQDSPERRCILTGEHGSRNDLIRLALGPDGSVAPDIMARAPGRGAWIGVTRSVLVAALGKGKLDGALSRAFKGAMKAPADLPDRIDSAFQRLFLDRLGLDMRSGHLITGADKIDQGAREGRIVLLLHASDAAEDGRRKRDQAWRVGQDAEGSGLQGVVLPLGRDALSAALGKDNAVHLAIIDAAAAQRTNILLRRWCIYAEWDKGTGKVALDG